MLTNEPKSTTHHKETLKCCSDIFSLNLKFLSSPLKIQVTSVSKCFSDKLLFIENIISYLRPHKMQRHSSTYVTKFFPLCLNDVTDKY